ncbi:MAG: endonuclease/exonuclease/phosphatase family protein [Bacteroidota bacterium]
MSGVFTFLFKWLGRLISLCALLALLAGLIDPRTFWIPSIISPVLPWLLLLVGVLLLLLLYRKKYQEAILPGLVLIFAIPALRKTIAWSKVATADEQLNTLQLTTANVATLKSPSDNFPLDSNGVKELAQRLSGVDLLFLQEFSYEKGDWRTQILRSTGKFTHFLSAEGGSLAIFSKMPVHKVDEHFFENTVNGYLSFDLTLDGGPLRCINVHLQSNRVSGMAKRITKEGRIQDASTWQTVKQMFGRYGRTTRTRTAQAEHVSQQIEESPYPVLLAGDFNDVPTSFPYRFLRTARLCDAWLERGTGLGTTFAGPIPGLRIDYILVDTSLQVLETEVLPNGHADHHPVRVEIQSTY